MPEWCICYYLLASFSTCLSLPVSFERGNGWFSMQAYLQAEAQKETLWKGDLFWELSHDVLFLRKPFLSCLCKNRPVSVIWKRVYMFYFAFWSQIIILNLIQSCRSDIILHIFSVYPLLSERVWIWAEEIRDNLWYYKNFKCFLI